MANYALTPERLQRRFILFGLAVCRSIQRMRHDVVVSYFASQLVRSASSPAANYAEASAAESRRDFVHKLQLCLKELRETSVWLQFVEALGRDGSSLVAIRKECSELTAIVVASLNTARAHQNSRKRAAP